MKKISKKDNLIVSIVIYTVTGIIAFASIVFLVLFLISARTIPKQPNAIRDYLVPSGVLFLVDLAIYGILLCVKYLTDQYNFTQVIEDSLNKRD
jgi:hypothetical protein